MIKNRKIASAVSIAFVFAAPLRAAPPQDEHFVTESIHLKPAVRFCIEGNACNSEILRLTVRLLSERGGAEVNSRDQTFTITDVKENVESVRRLIEAYHDPESLNIRGNSLEKERNADIDAAIRAVLDTQAAAWNRGDIEGYMDGYDRSPKTEFVGGDTINRGWQSVLDRYKQRYDTREKMGFLTFSDLEITVLSKDAALVLGRWRLKRTNDEPHGTFTLLFRKTKAGWRIVHDHTSSA